MNNFPYKYLMGQMNDDIQRMTRSLNDLEEGKLKKLVLKKIKLNQTIVSKLLELQIVCDQENKSSSKSKIDNDFN